MSGATGAAAPGVSTRAPETWEDELYEDWKRNGGHIAEYASELVETAWLVFWVVVIVALMFAPDSPVPGAMQSTALRLFVTGLLLGGVSWLAALSPPGRLSGAHLNPAISLGFWCLDKMHHRDLAGYVVAQLTGGVAGAWLGSLVVPGYGEQVRFAALHPGDHVSTLVCFGAEVGTTFALALVVYTFVSHAALKHWTAFAATIAVGVLVWLDGNVSGAGMNPARWIGPAVVISDGTSFWIYAVGPLLGAFAAATVRRTAVFTDRTPHTGKVVHDPGFRSIFKHDCAPSTPPRGLRK